MGIFGAMNTAVSGLRAQSYALENISGNIANSQTTGYKRIDTAFQDLVSGAAGSKANQQTAGMVLASSVPTNDLQGDIQPSTTPTHLAINGDGYFVVAQPSGTSDGNVIFSGVDLYTRRGDFEVDPSGYLVNKAGYYLKGFEVDKAGNPLGSVPQVIKVGSDYLPAERTTQINYKANLPSYPLTGNSDSKVPGSELLNEGNLSVNPRPVGTPATIGVVTGTGLSAGGAADLSGVGGITAGSTITLSLGTPATTASFTIGSGAGEYNTLAALVAAINAAPELAGANGITADDTTGQLRVTANSGNADFQLTGTGNALAGFGTTAQSVNSIPAGTGTVVGADAQEFLKSSLAGQAVTVYDSNGSPINVQFRWAKVDSTESGGTDTWNLFYLANSNATGNQVAWQNVGQNFTFNASGQLTSPTGTSIDITNLTVNGAGVGNVSLNYGTNGVTQFYDANGAVQANLTQNGLPSGSFVGISISNDGQVIATYSNNKTVPLAKIPLVSFNGDSGLVRLDGGAFAASNESGPPINGATGSLVSKALEASNTDIADEFSKLIITQQAYSANTKIISTSNEMLQDVLNVIR